MKYTMAVFGAVIGGVLIALEPTINGRLGSITSPAIATLHSSLTGMVIIVAISLVSGNIKNYTAVFKAPPYLLLAGLVGLGVVYFGSKVSPVLGIATTLSIMVAVQMITSILIDNFGLFGVHRAPVNIQKVIGTLLLLGGVQLITRS